MTPSGKQYFLLLIDDCSRYMWLHLLAAKSNTAAAIQRYKALVETETGDVCGCSEHTTVVNSPQSSSRSTALAKVYNDSTRRPTLLNRTGL
jgi:hypothetical protein